MIRMTICHSFVPIAAPSMTEQEAVQQCVQQCQASSLSTTALMWPSIGGMPVNELTTEDYFSCAFPTGASDFLGQHPVQVTIGHYFKHLLHYDDGRFPDIRDSVSLLSTRRCDIVLFRLAESMSGSTQAMAFSSRVLHYASQNYNMLFAFFLTFSNSAIAF